MLSVGTSCFEDRLCASNKDGIGGGGQVSIQGGYLGWLLNSLGRHWLDQWDTVWTYSLTDPFLSMKRVWLVRLHSPAPCSLVVGSEHNTVSELIAMF